MKVTKEFLLSKRTIKGGWSRRHFEILNIPFPPPKGWQKRIINAELTDEQIAALDSAKVSKKTARLISAKVLWLHWFTVTHLRKPSEKRNECMVCGKETEADWFCPKKKKRCARAYGQLVRRLQGNEPAETIKLDSLFKLEKKKEKTRESAKTIIRPPPSTYVVNINGSYEHREVFKRIHGQIPHGWVIHHVNGIKSDNRIENLIALPELIHKRLHEEMFIARRVYSREEQLLTIVRLTLVDPARPTNWPLNLEELSKERRSANGR